MENGGGRPFRKYSLSEKCLYAAWRVDDLAKDCASYDEQVWAEDSVIRVCRSETCLNYGKTIFMGSRATGAYGAHENLRHCERATSPGMTLAVTAAQ